MSPYAIAALTVLFLPTLVVLGLLLFHGVRDGLRERRWRREEAAAIARLSERSARIDVVGWQKHADERERQLHPREE